MSFYQSILFTIFAIQTNAMAASLSSSPLLEKLSVAVRQRQVFAVQTRLTNACPPDLKAHIGVNYETLLWQALFSSAGLPSPQDMPFTKEQRRIAEMLLAAEPGLMNEPVTNPPQSPLATTFHLYALALKHYGPELAKGVAERIQFLVEQGARFDGDLIAKANGWIELPLHLADLATRSQPESLALALELNADPNRYYVVKTRSSEQKVLLLDAAISHATEAGDEQFQSSMEVIEILLRHGADLSQPIRLEEPSFPVFYRALADWDEAVKDQTKGAKLQARYEQMFQLFFKHGLHPFSIFSEPYTTGEVGRPSILDWSIRYPHRRPIHQFFAKQQREIQETCGQDLIAIPISTESAVTSAAKL